MIMDFVILQKLICYLMINKLVFTEIFYLCKKIKPDFDKNKDIMYNIYYTNSVIDTEPGIKMVI